MADISIGASGVLGIAFETTPGTYKAPEKYVPFMSESLQHTQNTNWRRPIQGVADVVGAVAGDNSIEGEISIEVLPDTIPYFLYGMRSSVAKSGTSPAFTYAFTPTHEGSIDTTLSITIERAGEVFGYTGCVVGSVEFSIDNGLLMARCNIIGQNEATQAAPTPTYATTVPFGAGTYTIEIPTATQVFDADNFTLNIDDGAEAQFRLRDDRTTPSFVSFGEREVTLSVDRDFDDRAQYDAYKALTSQSITLRAEQDASNFIQFDLLATVADSYELGLSGQGDLVRASVEYMGVYDASGAAVYTIEVGTSEDITIPTP